MPTVTLSQEAEVNGKKHTAGETLSVSKSISDRLKAEGKIEDTKVSSLRKNREG